MEAGKSEPATPATLFQVGSIAKVVVAVAALKCVERGLLELNGDVNQSLVSWHVPVNEFTARERVTLWGLLSHSAGVTVHGFRGYALGEEVPNLQQILDGEWPANSPPIRVDTVPGTKRRYSGGGYMIVQQRGQGVVILTNGDNGDALWREILNGVSVEYGWVRDYTNLSVGIVAGLVLALAGIVILR